MRLDTDPFPANVNVINFEEMKVLVHPDQADTTKGKSVIVSDEPRVRMLKPRNPEPGKWKVNQWPGPCHRVKSTSYMLLEKYTRQPGPSVFRRLGASCSSIPQTSMQYMCGGTLLVLAWCVGVGTLQVSVHHPNAETGKGLHGERARRSGSLW
jgi:hypothetical protein